MGGRHGPAVALARCRSASRSPSRSRSASAAPGEALVYLLGGWAPPLGIALRADGLSAAMMLITAVVIGGDGLFARADFGAPPGAPESARVVRVLAAAARRLGRRSTSVFLGSDLFNLYVALELLTFAAVPLVCLDGRAETLPAALRYLLFALVGSVLYLLGAVLLYGAYGTLDIALLAAARAARSRRPGSRRR